MPIWSYKILNVDRTYSFEYCWKHNVKLTLTQRFNVCLFFFPLDNFSFIWRHHHYMWRAVNFDLCSAILAIEQWGLFNVPHLLWHGPNLYMYNDHFRGPMTLKPVAELLAVLTTWVCPNATKKKTQPFYLTLILSNVAFRSWNFPLGMDLYRLIVFWI